MATETPVNRDDAMNRAELEQERDGYILAGVGVGALVGFILGFTFWTHAPNEAIIVVTVIFVLVCAAAGGAIGKLASGINFDS
ncbi:MAG: hypothetical protein HC911_10040 [Chloroflexaceae bacterium]|nr:hypothetical protein [Chloroflexaceae bacterium]